MKCFLILFGVVLLNVTGICAVAIPTLEGRFIDNANVLSSRQCQSLSITLERIKNITGTQIVILTVGTTEGETIESFSKRVVKKWDLEQQKADDFVLLLGAIDDGKFMVKTGALSGWKLSDELCDELIDRVLLPEFKKENYYQGLSGLVSQISIHLDDEVVVKVKEEVVEDVVEEKIVEGEVFATRVDNEAEREYIVESKKYDSRNNGSPMAMLAFLLPILIVVGRLIKKNLWKVLLLTVIIVVFYVMSLSIPLTCVTAFFMTLGFLASGGGPSGLSGGNGSNFNGYGGSW